MKATRMHVLFSTAVLCTLGCTAAHAQQSNEAYFNEQAQRQQQEHNAEMNRQGYLQQQQQEVDAQSQPYGQSAPAQSAEPAMPMSEAMDILSHPPTTYGPAAEGRRIDGGGKKSKSGRSDPPSR